MKFSDNKCASRILQNVVNELHKFSSICEKKPSCRTVSFWKKRSILYSFCACDSFRFVSCIFKKHVLSRSLITSSTQPGQGKTNGIHVRVLIFCMNGTGKETEFFDVFYRYFFYFWHCYLQVCELIGTNHKINDRKRNSGRNSTQFNAYYRKVRILKNCTAFCDFHQCYASRSQKSFFSGIRRNKSIFRFEKSPSMHPSTDWPFRRSSVSLSAWRMLSSEEISYC